MQPRFGGPPLALYCDWRDFEYFRGLFNGQSSEESHFHDLAFALVHCRQTRERLVEREKLTRSLIAGNRDTV